MPVFTRSANAATDSPSAAPTPPPTLSVLLSENFARLPIDQQRMYLEKVARKEPLVAVHYAAIKAGIDPKALERVAFVESSGGVQTRGAANEFGALQILPSTWREVSRKYKIPYDPSSEWLAIEAGARYFKEQLDRFRDPDLAAAAYNAGPSRVARLLRLGLSKEAVLSQLPETTQKYVKKVSDEKGKAPLPTAPAPVVPLAEPGAEPPQAPASSRTPSPPWASGPTRASESPQPIEIRPYALYSPPQDGEQRAQSWAQLIGEMAARAAAGVASAPGGPPGAAISGTGAAIARLLGGKDLLSPEGAADVLSSAAIGSIPGGGIMRAGSGAVQQAARQALRGGVIGGAGLGAEEAIRQALSGEPDLQKIPERFAQGFGWGALFSLLMPPFGRGGTQGSRGPDQLPPPGRPVPSPPLPSSPLPSPQPGGSPPALTIPRRLAGSSPAPPPSGGPTRLLPPPTVTDPLPRVDDIPPFLWRGDDISLRPSSPPQGASAVIVSGGKTYHITPVLKKGGDVGVRVRVSGKGGGYVSLTDVPPAVRSRAEEVMRQAQAIRGEAAKMELSGELSPLGPRPSSAPEPSLTPQPSPPVKLSQEPPVKPSKEPPAPPPLRKGNEKPLKKQPAATSRPAATSKTAEPVYSIREPEYAPAGGYFEAPKTVSQRVFSLDPDEYAKEIVRVGRHGLRVYVPTLNRHGALEWDYNSLKNVENRDVLGAYHASIISRALDFGFLDRKYVIDQYRKGKFPALDRAAYKELRQRLLSR